MNLIYIAVYVIVSLVLFGIKPLNNSLTLFIFLALTIFYFGKYFNDFMTLRKDKEVSVFKKIILILVAFTFPIAWLKIKFNYYSDTIHLLYLIVVLGFILYYGFKINKKINQVLLVWGMFWIISLVFYLIPDMYFFKVWNRHHILYEEGMLLGPEDYIKRESADSNSEKIHTAIDVKWKINHFANTPRTLAMAYIDKSKSWVVPDAVDSTHYISETYMLKLNQTFANRMKRFEQLYMEKLKEYRKEKRKSLFSKDKPEFTKLKVVDFNTRFMNIILEKNEMMGLYFMENAGSTDSTRISGWHNFIDGLYRANYPKQKSKP